MDYILPLAGLALVHLLAVVSPGPSFVVVAQVAAARSRRAGVMASLAMTIGAGIWAIAAMVGLQALFARFETLYTVMRIAGGLYLLWIACKMWRHAGAPLPAPQPGQDPGSTSDVFRRALLVQLSNPKLVVFMGSIFLALLPADAPLWVSFAAIAIVLANEFGWYALVALVFSAGPARDAYRRAQRWIDRTMGVVLGGLGLRLMLDRS
jgi:RhtB (resistance to homoserine/threonine) family protein